MEPQYLPPREFMAWQQREPDDVFCWCRLGGAIRTHSHPRG